MKNEEIADSLEELIVHLDTLYEEGKECVNPLTGEIVSDFAYDKLRADLVSLRPDSFVFNSPTVSEVTVVKKITHNPPLTSISKASHENRSVQEEQLFSWMNGCLEKLPEPSKQNPQKVFYSTYKLDGVACALYYEKGILVAAGLRPRDGINGEDITEQIRYVDEIPKKLKTKISCSVRGELICKISDFKQVQNELIAKGEKPRANPRNHVAGGIRQLKDPSKVKDQRLSFIAYSIESLENVPYKTEMERAEWCRNTLQIPFVEMNYFDFKNLSKMENEASKLEYEVDGVVIGVNSLEDQEQLGRHGDTITGNPRGKIAWKFAEERANPFIKKIEWKTGRTGNIKPVGSFDPVNLAGTQVQRATLHNLGFMFRNNIKLGTQIIVLKAGKIIPKVIGTLSERANYQNIEEVERPLHCPSCGMITKIRNNQDDTFELFCPNSKDCPSQNIQSLLHYLDSLGVLGIGESTITSLVEGGVVQTFVDFYKLTSSMAMDCGLTIRESLLTIAAIWMIPSPEKFEDSVIEEKIKNKQKSKLNIPAWKLFSSFGIESAGKSAGKALVNHFNSFDFLLNSTKEDLETVKDVGEKTANIICKWFKENKSKVLELLNYIDAEVPKTGPWTGKTFVLTGGFPNGKKSLETQIESMGGKCSSSVSKNTDYVIVGTDAGAKEKKAEELGIQRLSLEGFEKLFSEL